MLFYIAVSVLAYFTFIFTSVSIFTFVSLFSADLKVWKYYRKCLEILFGRINRSLNSTVCEKHAVHCSNPECSHVPVKSLSSRNLLTCDPKVDSSENVFDTPLSAAMRGLEAIVSDDFVESILPGELDSWNLLRRTHPEHATRSFAQMLLYSGGVMFRYGFLLPVRTLVMANAMIFLIIASATLSKLTESSLKRQLDYLMNLTFFRILATSFGLSVTYHDCENRPRNGSVCVANHCTPIDIPILTRDNYYSLVGQKHIGWLGLIERRLEKVSQHIWFDRFEKQDRLLTRNRLSTHAKDGKPPILIFPEGVCSNNTAVLKFRKGSFELGAPIYPVVIKYNRLYGEPMWHQDQWFQHHLDAMTTWGMEVDVFYLPPTAIKPNETPEGFANRVQRLVSTAGSFSLVKWDGSLKYKSPPGEMKHDIQRTESTALLNLMQAVESC